MAEFLKLIHSDEGNDPIVRENIIWLIAAMIEQSYLSFIVDLLVDSKIISVLHDFLLKQQQIKPETGSQPD